MLISNGKPAANVKVQRPTDQVVITVDSATNEGGGTFPDGQWA